jgi:hypothetical protein
MNVRSLTKISSPKKLGTDVGRHPLCLAPEGAPCLFGLGAYLAFLLLDLPFNLLPHYRDFALPLVVCSGLLLLKEAVTFGACLPQRILITRETLFNPLYSLARLARAPARPRFTLTQDSSHRPEQKSVQDEYHCDNDRNMNYERAIRHQLYRFGEG